MGKRFCNNLRLQLGTKAHLWNKVMKEVQAKRVIGPLKEEEIPFSDFIVSPLGLIEKKGAPNAHRMIYHLSYPRDKATSVNDNIASWRCKVKFKDLDTAVQQALNLNSELCFFSASDFHQAFRGIHLVKHCWPYLIMMAEDPDTGECYYFIEKNLLFGLAIA